MKTFIKVLCVLMCLLMALSVLSACKDKPETPPDDPTPVDNDDPTPDPKPEDPDSSSELLDDIMRARYPGKTVNAIITAGDLYGYIDYVNSAGGLPTMTENDVFYLAADIDLNPGWSSAARVKSGKYLGPSTKPQNIFDGFEAFYGIFDGNGHTISGVYMSSEMYEGDSLGFFKVLGGTVKNLTIANSFIEGTLYEDAYTTDLYIDSLGQFTQTLDGSNSLPSIANSLSATYTLDDMNLGALAGKTVGDNVVIENVTVRANVIFRADQSAAIGGVIGSSESDSLTFKSVEYYGKVGLVGSDNSYPSSAKEVAISQFVGDAHDNRVTAEACVAGGILVCDSKAIGADTFCGIGSSALLVGNDCRVEVLEDDTPTDDVIEIYVPEDLLALWNDSTYEGKVIRLMADINFNALEWMAGKAALRQEMDAPTRFWEGIPNFKGTFDGNGHTISGLCRMVDLSKVVIAGGFVDILGEGAVIKNLTITNSAMYVYTSTGEIIGDFYLGGIAATAEGNATLENLFFEIDIWMTDAFEGHTGKILADTDAQASLTLTDASNYGRIGKVDSKFLANLFDQYNPYGGSEFETEIIEVYTATDLMYVMYAAQDGEKFAGKTVRLMNNIDLNPGFDLSARLSDVTNRLSFPGEPANVWLGIPTFCGLFDGNGYCISGIYSWRNKISSNDGHCGGFIDVLKNGGTIKNLIITNSIHVVNNTGDAAWGSRNLHTAGLVAMCDRDTDDEHRYGAIISNVYVDMDVVLVCSNHGTVAGILGISKRYSSTVPYRMENVVFAGRIVNTDFTKVIPFTSPKDQFAMAQIVADNNWTSAAVLSNVLAAGQIVCGNTSGVHAIFGVQTYRGGNGSTPSLSNVLVGRWEELPETCYNPKTDLDDASLNAAGLSYSEDLGFYLPTSVKKMLVDSGAFNDVTEELKTTFVPADPDPNKIHVSTAAELIALAQSGKDFEGQTIYLDNDIDFNPGWSAKTEIVDGKVVFPEEPAVTWTAFANFKGRINGQGHTISGLYSKRTVVNNTGNYGGLIDTQSDGSIKNLAIVNSIHIVVNSSWGSKNIHVGGLAGGIKKTQIKSADKNKNKYAMGNSENYGLIVSSFFTDMEVWYVSAEQAVIGGLIGMVDAKYNMNNFVYAGKVGNTNSLEGGTAYYVSSKGSSMAMGQIIGCGNFHSGVYMEDAIVVGSLITGTTGSDARYIHTYVGSDDKGSRSRCFTLLTPVCPSGIGADKVQNWYLSEGGFVAPIAIKNFVDQFAASLILDDSGTKLIGVGILPKDEAFGISFTGNLCNIVVPAGVKIIEEGAFDFCTPTSVRLPDGLESLGASLFANNTGLRSINLPNSLVNIGKSAFAGCTSLGNITIPENLASLGAYAFEGCTNLTFTGLENSKLDFIGNYAFAGCVSLGEIKFPVTLTNIGNSAFDGCINLQLTTIPAKVSYIGVSAFRGCDNLTDITFAYESGTGISVMSGAFSNLQTIRVSTTFLLMIRNYEFFKQSVQTIVVTSGTKLDKNTIYDYIKLTSFTLADTVTTIESNAFNSCPLLETVTIPANVTTIEEGAFRNMRGLNAYVVDAANQNYTTINGDLYTVDGMLIAYAAGKTDTVFTIPGGLTSIGAYAFNGAPAVTSVVFEGSKAEWGERGVTIADNAFDAPILITCTDGVTCAAHTIVIDVEAVAPTCTATGLTIGTHCSLCGDILSVSEEIAALGHVYGEDNRCTRCGELKPSAGLDFVSNGDGTCYVSGIGGYESLDVEIPETSPAGDTVVGIGNFAFAGTAITSISIPATIESIGTGAFANCSSLVIDFDSVAAGNAGGYTSTDKGIFANSGKTLVRFTSSQYETSYTAPKSVTVIEDYAFSGCVYMTAISAISGRNANPNYKGSNSCLYSKDGKTFVAFPAGKDNTSYTIDANTVSIANGAFWGCTNLTSVTLASTVTTIGDYAFYGCTNLATINLNGATLTSIGTNAFEGTALETIPTVAN